MCFFWGGGGIGILDLFTTLLLIALLYVFLYVLLIEDFSSEVKCLHTPFLID